MYTDKRCCIRHALIHGKARHCPAVKEYFSMNGDTDINTTENDYVCTTCYNHHLSIVQSAENTSTDKELKQLLSSPHTPVQWSEPYTSHITAALNGIITRLDSCADLDVHAPGVQSVKTGEVQMKAQMRVRDPIHIHIEKPVMVGPAHVHVYTCMCSCTPCVY